MYISIEKEKMKNKYYDLRAVMLANIKWEYSCYSGFYKQDLKGSIRGWLGVSSRKADSIFETLLELDVIDKNDNDLYSIKDVKEPFVALSPDEVVFCIRSLSALELKIYCYFLYFKKDEYWFITNNRFTIKELVEMCGYSYSNRNCNIFKDTLNHLEELRLIRYIHDSVYDLGGDGGPKKILCEVNKISDVIDFNDIHFCKNLTAN